MAQRGNTRCRLGPFWDRRLGTVVLLPTSTFVAACVNSNQPPSTRRSSSLTTPTLYYYQSAWISIYVNPQGIPRPVGSDRHPDRCLLEEEITPDVSTKYVSGRYSAPKPLLAESRRSRSCTPSPPCLTAGETAESALQGRRPTRGIRSAVAAEENPSSTTSMPYVAADSPVPPPALRCSIYRFTIAATPRVFLPHLPRASSEPSATPSRASSVC